MSHEEINPVELIAGLRAGMAQREERDLRLEHFAAGVQSVSGPLGELLRTIVAMQDDCIGDATANHVTEAELIRMEQIVDAGLALYEAWFRGEQ